MAIKLSTWSDWNPQLFRELKGRVKPRSLVLTAISSLVGQVMVVVYRLQQLPPANATVNHYCTGTLGDYQYEYGHQCLTDSSGNLLINWQRWWADLFTDLSLVLPFLLMAAGVYLLISDMGKEGRQQTLNLIRLSPQSSQTILLGKLLGVPILPYLAIGLVIPLHWLAAAQGGIGIDQVAALYWVVGAATAFFYTAALLYAMVFAFLGYVQGITGAGLVLGAYNLFYVSWQNSQELKFETDERFPPYPGPDEWFHLFINRQLWLITLFAVTTFGVAAFWCWKAINRHFRNPNLALLSKRQSYLATACFGTWLIGFMYREDGVYDSPFYALAGWHWGNLLWCLVMIMVLTPQRQIVLDWARYRRERGHRSKHRRQLFWNAALIKDLVWGENSPAVVAIALNLLIMIALLTPWLLTAVPTDDWAIAVASPFLSVLFVLLCAVLAQLVLLLKTNQRQIVAIVTLATLTFAPPFILSFMSFEPDKMPVLWLFSGFSFIALEHVTVMEVFASLLTHLGILSLLTVRLTRQLRQASESETKALLTGV